MIVLTNHVIIIIDNWILYFHKVAPIFAVNGWMCIFWPAWLLVLPVVERCMCTMQTGTQMTKMKGKKKGLVRFFYLDEHKSCIRWRPSRKHDKAKSELLKNSSEIWLDEADVSSSSSVAVTIDSIHEVCEGKRSEIFRRYADNRFDPNYCFSIYYGERVKSLDLVSTNAEEARTWITGLTYLMAGISDEDSLARRQRTRDQYPLSSLSLCLVSNYYKCAILSQITRS